MLVARLDAQSQPVQVTPYTVVLSETFYHPKNPPLGGAQVTYAARADGSTVVAVSGANTVRRITFAGGTAVQIQENTKKKSTTAMDPPVNVAGWHRDPRTSCVNRLDGRPWSSQPVTVSEESVSGYRAAKVVQKDETRWMALDYGCATLKIVAPWGPLGRRESILVKLTPGEPAAGLFSVPDDFKEGPPSELGPRNTSESCGPDCKATEKALLEKLDEAYYKHRPQ